MQLLTVKYNKDKKRALLVAMPWAFFGSPCLSISCLKSYARQEGHNVDCLHLYLKMAISYGFKEYEKIAYDINGVGEILFACKLFPQKKKSMIAYLGRYVDKPDSRLELVYKIARRLYRSVEWEKYDLVGFSIVHGQLFSSLLFADWIKRDYPNKRIVFGGPLVVGDIGASLLSCFRQVDWCVDGEGEVSFAKLLDCLFKNAGSVEDNVPGLVYRNGNDILINPRRELPRLNKLPDPDFDDYFKILNNAKLRKREVAQLLPVESSRGCPNRCAFCSIGVFWDRYRIRPYNDVAAQLKRLSSRYYVNHFAFVDATASNNICKKLFSSIAGHRLDYRIYHEFRADLNKDCIMAMKQAGVDQVLIGIETLSTNLLKKMNKERRTIDNLQAMKFYEEAGIENTYNIIINFPTESQKDVNETVRNIDYAAAYRPPVQLRPFILYHGSVIFKKAQKYGLSMLRNVSPFNKLFPRKINDNILFLVKDFHSQFGRCNYRRLRKCIKDWEHEYRLALINNIKPLGYYNLGANLIIEDFRKCMKVEDQIGDLMTTIMLEGDFCDLYLYCDSIKSFDEIKKRFPKWDEQKIKKVLNKLVKLKVMFREDDDYLSLAIRANSHIK